MEEIYGSAQQTLSKARQQAMKYNYPYFMLVTSTPNGTVGTGEWFYKRWQNGVDSDELFVPDGQGYEDWNPNIDVEAKVADRNKNTFVRVSYHWSEDPSKDDKWYQEQCQELDDQRKVNQELDLLFVGSTDCIFDDDTLSKFKAQKPIETIDAPYGSKLNVFKNNLDPNDYYIIGADTAQSLVGNYCAIQVFSFKEFEQVAELGNKFGSYTDFGNTIGFTFQWIYRQVGGRIILAVENNTIGQAPIEVLTRHSPEFNYTPYFDKDYNKAGELGLKTTGMTKPLMVGCLLETIKENQTGFKSQQLINQFGSIEKTSTGTIKSKTPTDLFMAACFCAYSRKRNALEIMPQIQFTAQQNEMRLLNTVKMAASVSNPKQHMNEGQMWGMGDSDYNFNGTQENEYDAFSPFCN